MQIIDMHCDTLLECYQKNYGLRKNAGHLDLLRMKNAGALAQFFAIYLPMGDDSPPYGLFQEIYQIYAKELEKNSDLIAPAFTYDDVLIHEREGRMSSILSVEDGHLLGGKLERLDELYAKGVRLVTLLWCRENCIGFPDSFKQKEHQQGLKPFGFDVIEKMNRLGMIIDVSHLSEGGFYDVAAHSKKPFVASHSCARSLCDHSRNLADQQLRCISTKGGVVGVNYNSYFLREGSALSTMDDILLHIDYLINEMGTEGVALGSDFDGIDCRLEMTGYGQYEKLIRQLEKRYPAETVEKICYKNVLRVLKECCN